MKPSKPIVFAKIPTSPFAPRRPQLFNNYGIKAGNHSRQRIAFDQKSLNLSGLALDDVLLTPGRHFNCSPHVMIPLELVHLSAQEAHVSTQLPAAGSSDSAIKIGSTGLQRTEAAVVECDLRYESEQLFPRPPINRTRSEIDDNKAILTGQTCSCLHGPRGTLPGSFALSLRERPSQNQNRSGCLRSQGKSSTTLVMR